MSSIRFKLRKKPTAVTEWGNAVLTCKGIITVPCEASLHRHWNYTGWFRRKYKYFGNLILLVIVKEKKVHMDRCVIMNVAEIQLFESTDLTAFDLFIYRPWGPTSLLYNGYWVTFPVVKRPGRGVDHPLPSSTEVQERVELYLYSPTGPSWSFIEWNLPSPLPYYLFIYVLIYLFIYLLAIYLFISYLFI